MLLVQSKMNLKDIWKRIISKRESLRKVFIFATKLLILSFLMYIISLNVNFLPMQEASAEFTDNALNALNIPTEREKIRIGVQGKDFLITEDCTAWKGMFFFLSLVIASGSTLKKTVKGLAVGIPVIYALNLLRILLLILFTVQLGPHIYDLLHTFLWQTGMVVSVFILWVMWLRRGNFLTKDTTD